MVVVVFVHMHCPVKKVSRVLKKKKTENLPGAQDMSSRAPWVVVGCYGSDGGGSGDGHCGCCTCSPV